MTSNYKVYVFDFDLTIIRQSVNYADPGDSHNFILRINNMANREFLQNYFVDPNSPYNIDSHKLFLSVISELINIWI